MRHTDADAGAGAGAGEDEEEEEEEEEEEKEEFTTHCAHVNTHMSFPTACSCSIGSSSTFFKLHSSSSSLALACKGR